MKHITLHMLSQNGAIVRTVKRNSPTNKNYSVLAFPFRKGNGQLQSTLGLRKWDVLISDGCKQMYTYAVANNFQGAVFEDLSMYWSSDIDVPVIKAIDAIYSQEVAYSKRVGV